MSYNEKCRNEISCSIFFLVNKLQSDASTEGTNVTCKGLLNYK